MINMLAMSSGNWFVLIVATVIAVGITERIKCSNWWIIPIAGGLFVGTWFVLGIFKIVWLLLPLFIFAGVALYLLNYFGKQGEKK